MQELTSFKFKDVLANQYIKTALKFRFVKSYIFLVLLYGMEIWTLKVTDINKPKAFEMWVYRRLLKIPWTARITNTKVFQRTNQDRQLLAVVKQRKTAYLIHIMRNKIYQLLQLILQGIIK